MENTRRNRQIWLTCWVLAVFVLVGTAVPVAGQNPVDLGSIAQKACQGVGQVQAVSPGSRGILPCNRYSRHN